MAKVKNGKTIVMASDLHFNSKINTKASAKKVKSGGADFSGSGLYDLGFNSNLSNLDDSHTSLIGEAMDLVMDQKMVSDLSVILVKGDMVCAGKKDTGSGSGKS